MDEKGGLNLDGCQARLSNTEVHGCQAAVFTAKQQAIHDLLFVDGLTERKAAVVLKISQQAIHKQRKYILQKLCLSDGCQKQGVVKLQNKKTPPTLCLENEPEMPIEHIKELDLHNIQISIKILRKTAKYAKVKAKCNKLSLMGFTAMLYDSKIELYTQQGTLFNGTSTAEIYGNAIDLLSKVYGKLENRLGIIIHKDQYLNKRWVRQHIAEHGSEIAKSCNDSKERLIEKADDGQQRVITDKSFNQDHLEFVHPDTAKSDTDFWIKFIHDLMQNRPPMPSEIYNLTAQNSKLTAVTSAQQMLFDANIRKHMTVLTDIGAAINELRTAVQQLSQQKSLL